MTGIFLYLKHVAGLLDRCYEREALLHANHIHSFAPLLRFDEQLATSPEELAEHRAFLAEGYKGYLWPDEAAATAFDAARDEDRRRAQESGNSWEGQPTAFLRRRMKMQFQHSERFRELFAPYKDARAKLFDDEVRHAPV